MRKPGSTLTLHICPLKAVRTIWSPHRLSRDSGMTGSFGCAKTKSAGQNILKWTAMPDIVEPERILPLLKPYLAAKMEEWRVGDAARNPRNDSPEIIKLLTNK